MRAAYLVLPSLDFAILAVIRTLSPSVPGGFINLGPYESKEMTC